MAYQSELEKLERRYDEDPARHFAQLADAYRRDGRLDEALGILREHLAARPNYVSGLIVLGRCLLDQKNDAEARETFERVLAVDAEHIIALRALGEIGERTGDTVSARTWYRRLLDIDPMNDEAVAALGRIPDTAGEAAPVPPDEPAEPEAPARPEPAAPAPSAAAPRRESGPPPATPAAARTGEFVGEDPREGKPVEPPGEAPPEVAAGDELVIERTSTEHADAEASAAAWGDDVPSGAQILSGFADLDADRSAQERTLAFDEVPGADVPDAAAEEPPSRIEDLGAEPFDESLGWDAGERMSHQISAEDLTTAEAAHADDLAAPLEELPGLHRSDFPTAEEIAAAAASAPVDGLQWVGGTRDAEPVEGLETGEASDRPPEPPASEEGEDRASLAGLPVIFPPEETPGAPLRVEPEPEPVVTETMAELYVRQGLVAEALDTYRQLLAHRPHDRRLAGRLAELEASAARGEPRIAYAASVTGGQPSRGFLADVLAARAGLAPVVEEAAPPPPEAPAPAAEATVVSRGPGPTEPEPIDVAPAGEAAEPDRAPEPAGAPTQPAGDELSLAAIFGEPAPPSEEPPRAPAREDHDRSPGGFSFDEFFAAAPPADDDTEAARPPRDTPADDEGDDAFRDWLKGLKS